MPRRLTTPALLAVAALLIPACARDDSNDYRFPVHPTDGKVVHRGQPVANAIVRFHPADPATTRVPEGKQGPPLMLTTETDEHGLFSLSTYLADDGVPAGDYRVTVAAGLPEKDVENADDAPAKPANTARASLKKYRDPATTTLKANVRPGQNHLVLELQ